MQVISVELLVEHFLVTEFQIAMPIVFLYKIHTGLINSHIIAVSTGISIFFIFQLHVQIAILT